MYNGHVLPVLTFFVFTLFMKESVALSDEEERNQTKAKDFVLKTPSQERCFEYGTCTYNEGLDLPNCHCDRNCDFYKDCCFDAQHTTEASKTTIDSYEYQSCEVLNNVMYHGVWMISKCPKHQNTLNNISKCESKHVIDIPVTGDNGKIYRNVYCALCHNVKAIEFWKVIVNFKYCTFFDLQFLDDNNVEKRLEIMIQNGCRTWLIPPVSLRNNSRSCLKEKNVYTFENDSHPYCKRYLNPVFGKTFYIREIIHRNAFCSQTIDHGCLFPVVKYKEFLEKSMNVHVSNAMPMYVLFRFNPAVNPSDTRPTCITGDKYDQERGICLTSSCSTQQDDDEHCSPEVVHNYVFNYELILYTDKIVAKNTLMRASSMFYVSLPHYIHVRKSELKFILSLSCGMNGLTNQTCCSFSQKLSLIFNKPFETIRIRNTIKEIQQMVYEYKEHHIYELHNDLVLITNKNSTCLLQQSNTTKKRMTGNPDMFNKMKSQFGEQNLDIQEIPRSSIVEMNVTDEDADNTQVAIRNWLLDYKRSNDSVTTQKPLYDTIQIIITYVTMSVSSFAIMVTVCLFVYCNFCRSVPDKICINILLTILSFYLIYMVGIGFTDNQWVCFAIGIILHYILLSTFTWISVYCGMVMKMLSSTSLSKFGTSVKVVYCLGYGIPVFFVLPSVILDMLNTPQIEVSYSGDVCFPTGFPGNLVFFTVPVVLSILSNTILLLIAFKKLKFHNDEVMNTLARDTTSYTSTYIKLCFLSGFFWSFGIFAQIFNSYELQIAFTLFSGSQGLITSLCFAVSDRIRNYFKKKRIRKATVKSILELR